MQGFDLAAWETLHGGRKSIDDISRETGINKSSLYRYGLPKAASGLDIPARKLAPVMKAAGNYKMLHIVAASCGFLCVRPPKVPKDRADETVLISQLQKSTADAVVKVMEFFEKQTVGTMNDSTAALEGAASIAIGLKRMILRRGQLELAF